MSNTEELTEAEKIFIEVIELEESACGVYLDKHCGSNTALRTEVEKMLGAVEASKKYFDSLPGRLGVDLLKKGEMNIYHAESGQQFGHYQLTRMLGRGGMGEVWCAERVDGRFEGEVAVKLLTQNSRAAVSRFDREAHFLAKLTHPNIARMLDAGVGPDDVPYLILEFVEGENIDAWCDKNALGIKERLALFLKVTEAVIHAHSRLVIHSDIKPSNVLVTKNGNVKLLDFGIATLLESDSEFPQSLALTPEYAAPEQIAGGLVTATTDVYSLGLLLCNLLTGRHLRQFSDTSNLSAVHEELHKEPPPLLSTIIQSTNAFELHALAGERGLRSGSFLKLLRGELDPIVRRALAVNPDERYANVSDFAADIQRYLGNFPISVLPNTPGYHARKFLKRHRGSVLSSILIAIALLTSAVLTSLQSIEAKRQRDAAEYDRKRVNASNEFYGLLLEELGSANRPITALELLDRGAAVLENQFGSEQAFMGRIQFDLSRNYAALPEQKRELELLELAEQSARNTGDNDLLASVLCTKVSSTLQFDEEKARLFVAEAETTLNGLHRPSIESQFQCYRMKARLYQADNDMNSAISLLNDVRADSHLFSQFSAKKKAVFINDIGIFNYRLGNLQASLNCLQDAAEILQAAGRGNTFTAIKMRTNRAVVLASMGEFLTASEIHRDVIEQLDASGDWVDRGTLLQMRVNYASNLIRLSQGEKALAILQDVHENSLSLEDNRYAGISDIWLAYAYIELEQLEHAVEHLDTAEKVLAQSPKVWAHQLDQIELSRAVIARKRGEYDIARAILLDRLAPYDYPPLKVDSAGLGLVLLGLGWLELEAEEFSKSENYLSDNLEIEKKHTPNIDASARIGAALAKRAQARFGLGNVEGAIADLQQAVLSLGNGLGEDNEETLEAKELLHTYKKNL